MEKTTYGTLPEHQEYEIAQLSEACQKKIHEFEQELNKQGYWNIALVAYQLKN